VRQVVLDEHGTSKGFGFIRFGNEQEQQTAMTSMMGLSGLGGKPIKVSAAVQKDKKNNYDSNSGGMDMPVHLQQAVAQSVIGGSSSSTSYGSSSSSTSEYNSAEYYSQYSQYWSQYAAWQHYHQQWQQYNQSQGQDQQNPHSAGAQSHPFGSFPPAPPPPMEPAPPSKEEQSKVNAPKPPPEIKAPKTEVANPVSTRKVIEKRKADEDDENSLFGGPPSKLFDHGQSEKLEYGLLNDEFLSKSEEIYTSIDKSNWLAPPGEEE